jgi:hypothetical protein
MRLVMLLSLSAVSLFSQPFTAGVKAGVPLTDFTNAVSTQNFAINTFTNRYIIGPTMELRLPFGLGVEFDALYRHFGADAVSLFGTASLRSGAWEFPLLAKYRFPSRIVRPFVSAGVAWNTLSGLDRTVSIGGTVLQPDIAVHKDTIAGFVIGGGLDIHALFLHVSPEIRYTRWGSQHFTSTNSLISSNQNQAEFLVGFTF